MYVPFSNGVLDEQLYVQRVFVLYRVYLIDDIWGDFV